VEIIETLIAGFLVFALIAATVQVLFSYALQVIAEKNKLPDIAAFLAWIPLLNLYPLIRCGGGSFTKFLIGTVVGVALVVAAGVAGATSDAAALGVGAAVGAGVFALVAVIYMARIVMATAESRGLSKWLGLMAFVPLLNIFVYPYIAFHDGFRAPNKIGLVLGLLLAFGPLPGQLKMLETFGEQAKHFEAVLSGADPSNFDAAALQNAMGDFGAALEMGDALSMLEGMESADPEQMEGMQRELAAIAGDLDEDSMVLELQAMAEPMSDPVPDTPVGDRTGRGPAPPPASRATTASIGRDGERGFAIPESPGCPLGTVSKGSGPPSGLELWCERVGVDGGMKHGWLSSWHENENPAMAGEYRDGLRVGVWTRWYPSGGKRVQAEFVDGVQHGAMIAWDAHGVKVHESRFSAGALVAD
jgi:hypothetical protein